jgi:hypothetical protein
MVKEEVVDLEIEEAVETAVIVAAVEIEEVVEEDRNYFLQIIF